MKKTNDKKKLALDTQTLQRLDGRDLAMFAGGAMGARSTPAYLCQTEASYAPGCG